MPYEVVANKTMELTLRKDTVADNEGSSGQRSDVPKGLMSRHH